MTWFVRHTVHVRFREATVVSDDFRSPDTVRFPANLDGLRKDLFDCTRVLDAADVNFRGHRIRGAEMDAADAAQTLVKILPERNVPDAVQLNLVFAQIKATTLDDEFGFGQGVLREGQRQRKDGVAFSVGPENFLFVQVDAELAVFEGGHGMAPFVMGYGLVWVGLFVFYGIGSPPLNIIKRYDTVLIYYIISYYKLQS